MNIKNIVNPKQYNSKHVLISDFNENGFVSIKNLLNKDIINQLKLDLTLSLQLFLDNDKSFSENIIYLDKIDQKKLYEFHNETLKLFTHNILSREIYEVLRVLNNGLPLQLFSLYYLLGLPRDSRLAYDFHQEGNYMRGVGRIYNIHFPIFQKSTIENGTMSILLGSHKEGLLPFEKKRLSDNSYTDLIPLNINELQQKYNEAFCELEIGDCIIFDENLVHKSNFNNTDTSRTVGVWRVFGNIKSSIMQLKPDEL
jgi:hypothetical protein